jgi:hypothetical protein
VVVTVDASATPADLEAALGQRAKGDREKVEMAVRLRRETLVTVARIAERLQMGTKTHLAHLLYSNGHSIKRQHTTG